MDDFKQLNSSEIHSSQDFPSLISIFKNNGKTISDLILYDYNKQSSQLSKLSSRSIREVDDYLDGLKQDLSNHIPKIDIKHELSNDEPSFISTGLPTIDKQLGGKGIPLGELTEVFGSSGCGKSHLLSQLALRSQLLSTEKNQSIFIATESFLETKRLNDMKNQYNDDPRVSLDNITYIYCQDLESQDHIIYTQLPIKLQQLDGKVNLIIIDSIAQHLRREGSLNNCNYLKHKISKLYDQLKDLPDFQPLYKLHQIQIKKFQNKSSKYYNRFLKNHYLYLLNRHLYRLAIRYNVAIVIINQVSDFINSTIDNDDDFLVEDILNPLNVNFQIGLTSGWDTNIILHDQQQSLPKAKFQLNSKDLELTTYHLEKSLNQPQNKHQRVNTDGETFDPRYARQNLTNHDEDYNNQRDLLLKLHKLGNLNTKRVVPTLGYPWSIRIPIRIMLMKTYKPLMKDKKDWLEVTNHNSVVDPETGLTYEQLMEGFNVNNEGEDSTTTTTTTKKRSFNQLNSTTSIEALIKGWKVERYAKVVYSKYNDNDNDNDKIEFTITDNGLFEV
ncbi:P-loop containing nucleoside triphosphate hydrolase protein [Scheffersomyces coipomensis]|uniref:P-loop containing nucleoside triphosphate hydrolase protein n=1 Tax=Scheffersomyces coipomensis TaxID=1788519 RepID=UPI00315D7233